MGKTNEAAVITGGGGFVGFSLGCHLAASGTRVFLFDLRPPAQPLPKGVSFVQGDITSYESVEQALSLPGGVSCVYHVASYGMSGAEAVQHALIEQVNVTGTHNVIRACLAAGVPRLVYTSTYNTVFIGQRILGGDECMPLPPLSAFSDTYSRTKAQAERAVLAADGTALFSRYDPSTSVAAAAAAAAEVAAAAAAEAAAAAAVGATRVRRRRQSSSAGGGGGGSSSSSRAAAAAVVPSSGKAVLLRTCVIRPAAIYGPGEQRHLPRVISLTRAGLFAFVFRRDSDNLVDWVHIRNLVQSLELAAAGLTAGRRHVASGQAYFISDDAPVDNFEFFRPLLEGLGYRFPRLCLPFWLVLLAAWLMELAHAALRAVGLTWHPILVRQEVFKSGVTHYFSVAKARRELGYDPVAYDFGEVVEWMRQRGHAAAAAAAAGAQQQERSAAEASAAAGSAQAAGAKIGGKGGRRSRRTSSVVVAANQQQQRWSPLTNITVGAAMRAAMLGWAAFQGLMVATQGEGRAAATAAGAACVVLSLLSHHASARLQRLVAVALALALGGVALAAVATAGPGLMRRSTAY